MNASAPVGTTRSPSIGRSPIGSTKLGVERLRPLDETVAVQIDRDLLAVAHQPERKVVEQLVREHEVDRRPQLVGDLDPLARGERRTSARR